jgi:hypothetical protein
VSRFVAFVCLFLAVQAFAHERPSIEVYGVNERYEVVVPLVEEAPVIDGKIDSPFGRKRQRCGASGKFRPIWLSQSPNRQLSSF